MPFMTYFLTRMTMEHHDGSVSTKEIVSFVKENLPVCTDDIVFHLRELESAGILRKELSKVKRGFIWHLVEDLPPATMRERYPAIYNGSKFFRAIYETAQRSVPVFSGSCNEHTDLLLREVGKRTASMENKPGLEEMETLTAEVAATLNFTPVASAGPESADGAAAPESKSADTGSDDMVVSREETTAPDRASMTYAESGVDIYGEEDAIKALAATLTFRRTGTGAPVDLPGHFTGIIEFGDHYLSMCTDGVGTKILIADTLRKWDTVGIDCMAMNVNDLICIGAEPLAFVDYIAIDKPTPEQLRQIGMGLNEGARQSNLSIIGGETASLGEIVKGFDLAGTCLGCVKKEDFISGETIRSGDVIIGVESSGVHSNGFSLARRVFTENGYSLEDTTENQSAFPELNGTSPGAALLEPTLIYVREILSMLKSFKPHGLCNITGGGLRNIGRLNRSMDYDIIDPLPVLPIFTVMQRLGNMVEKEMYQTFNMGMGFCIVAAPEDAPGIIDSLESKAQVVGTVKAGSGKVLFNGTIYD